MLDPEEAWRRLAGRLEPQPAALVTRLDALGRVLATSLDATLDVPPSDVSAMDGFAVGPDSQAATALPVRLVVAAGDPPGAVLEPGTAARIMTGAPVPAGADRVVPIEDTRPGSTEVVLVEPGEPAQHIRRRGEVAATGGALLPAGHLVTPGTLSLLATHGYGRVAVVGRPRLAFLTTGSELVAPDEDPGPGQIRDSHRDFFVAAGRQLGLEVEILGIAPDRRDALGEKIAIGMRAGVLVLSGGVSMGDFDLVEGVLEEHGAEILFDAVAIQPGKPMVAARHPGGWVFALPGNPASAMVTFWLLVRPALRRMMGFEDGYWFGALRAELDGALPATKARALFLPCEVGFADGRLRARPVVPLGSHDVAAYARGTALLRVPARQPARSAGGECEILPLVEWPVALPR